MPGSTVILEDCKNPNRKTRYDLIAVYKDGLGLVNMDSQAPNKVVAEWLAKQALEDAINAGVNVLYLQCQVEEDSLNIIL